MAEFSPEQRTVVIIGAGPAGLTAAYELVKLGAKPIVLEQGDDVGGLSRTDEYKGFHFDMGGHRFFTKVPRVEAMWREVLLEGLLRRPRLSRIYYKGKFFNYPLKPWNALSGLGVVQSVIIAASYLRWQIFPYRREDTFEQWVTNRFGRHLFRTFFKAYTEKVWGISCSELKAEWAAQRIKDLSLRTAVLNMIVKPGRTIKTLIEEFDYPRRGPGMMWKAVRDEVEARGGRVRTGCKVIGVKRDGSVIKSIVVSTNEGSEEVAGTDFLSSMPLTEFVTALDPEPGADISNAASRLSHRDFLTVCLIVDASDLFPDNWIYVHDPEVSVGRIQNYKNWSPHMVPDASMSSLGLEYFCSEGDELWNTPDSELLELAKREVETIGLASAADVRDGCVVRVAKAYPVYDTDYASYLDTLKGCVGGLRNLQKIGRNGLHRYNNQDHAMLTGMFAVENLVHGAGHDLWSVNADSEYHEEIREELADAPPASDAEVEEAVRDALSWVFAKLDKVALGMATGVVGAASLAAASLFLVAKGGAVVGPHLGLMSQYLPGYEASLPGAALGLLYGAVAGFCLGWSYAALRNGTLAMYKTRVERRAESLSLRRLLDYL